MVGDKIDNRINKDNFASLGDVTLLPTLNSNEDFVDQLTLKYFW